MPYKAENCHAVTDEQYFSVHRFLGICPWYFKDSIYHGSMNFSQKYLAR